MPCSCLLTLVCMLLCCWCVLACSLLYSFCAPAMFCAPYCVTISSSKSHWYSLCVQVVASRLTNSSNMYMMIPPPLVRDHAYGMSAHAINIVLPALVPKIAVSVGVTKPVLSVFELFSGSEVRAYKTRWWQALAEGFTGLSFNPPGCGKSGPFASCTYYCDDQSCDPCHMNIRGNAMLTRFVYNQINWTLSGW